MILYHFLVLPNHKAKKGKAGWNYRERAEKKLKKCRKKEKVKKNNNSLLSAFLHPPYTSTESVIP